MDDGDPFAPQAAIAVVAEDGIPPGGPSAIAGWPSGGGQVASYGANAGPGWEW